MRMASHEDNSSRKASSRASMATCEREARMKKENFPRQNSKVARDGLVDWINRVCRSRWYGRNSCVLDCVSGISFAYVNDSLGMPIVDGAHSLLYVFDICALGTKHISKAHTFIALSWHYVCSGRVRDRYERADCGRLMLAVPRSKR